MKVNGRTTKPTVEACTLITTDLAILDNGTKTFSMGSALKNGKTALATKGKYSN